MSEKSQKNLGPTDIRHPEWCDPARCTATPTAATGQAHRSAPTPLTIGETVVAPLAVNVSLYKAHAPWLTEVYVELELSGHSANYRPASLRATVPAHKAGEVGQLLCGVAARASADQKEEIRQDLASFGGQVPR
jgi:hypothetical protein